MFDTKNKPLQKINRSCNAITSAILNLNSLNGIVSVGIVQKQNLTKVTLEKYFNVWFLKEDAYGAN